MHFDDRLGTVLRLRAEGAALQRVQLRQLVDLLGTAPVDAHGDQIEAAYARFAELARSVPPAERAAMLTDSGLRLRSPRLVAALGAGEEAVARAALVKARLDEEQWLDLIPALPPAARGHLRERSDLPPAVQGLLDRLGAHGRGLPPARQAADELAARTRSRIWQKSSRPKRLSHRKPRPARASARSSSGSKPIAAPVK